MQFKEGEKMRMLDHRRQQGPWLGLKGLTHPISIGVLPRGPLNDARCESLVLFWPKKSPKRLKIAHFARRCSTSRGRTGVR